MRRLLLFWGLFGAVLMGKAQLWEPLGGGLSTSAYDFQVNPSQNELFLCGQFKYAGDTLVNGLATWDGNRFQMFGGGIPDGVRFTPQPTYIYQSAFSIAPFENQVFICGHFDTIAGQFPSDGMARWDGVRWRDCGPHDGMVWLDQANEQLFGFGVIRDGSNGPKQAFGRWNGTEFEEFGTRITFSQNGEGPHQAEFYKGEYYFGGNFEEPNNLKEIMRWSGSQWLSLQSGVAGDAFVSNLIVYKDLLFVGGLFGRSEGNAGDNIMAWDGTDWIDPFPRVHFISPMKGMTVISNQLYLTGIFYVEGNTGWEGPFGIAKYDGTEFCAFGGRNLILENVAGFNDEIFVLSNQTICGSDSTGLLGDTVNFLGRWLGGDSTDICISQPVRIQDPAAPAPLVTLAPNPTQDHITFTLPQGTAVADLQIHDVAGRLVVPTQRYRAGEQVDVAALPAGLYFVEVRMRGLVEVLKMVKL